MDIAFPASLALERGLDSKSEMAVAQQDIEKYYDNLVVLRVARWLALRQGCIELVATLVAMHSCPCIILKVGGQNAVFNGRAVGMFTGSRSAAAAGRFPLLDVAFLRLSHWQQFGLKLEACTLGIATFVDNIFTIASTPESAVNILDDCAQYLLSRWGLRIGEDSREYITCKGYPKRIDVHSRWRHKTTMRALGHYLDNDGGTTSCVRQPQNALYDHGQPITHLQLRHCSRSKHLCIRCWTR